MAGRVLSLGVSGLLRDGVLVMFDHETRSLWPQDTASAIHGPLSDRTLTGGPQLTRTTWGPWRRRHPHSAALSVGGTEDIPFDPYGTVDGAGV